MLGGHPQGLACAERELGLESWAVALESNFFDYIVDETLFANNDNLLIRGFKRWQLLARALKDFDIIHFNFGQSIMPHWFPDDAPRPASFSPVLWKIYQFYSRLVELRDLPLLKKSGKGIVVTYQGDDARQGDFCRTKFEIHFANEVEPGYYTTQMDAHRRQRIRKFSRYADRIYALNPDLLYVLPPRAQFMPYAHIDLRDWSVINKASPDVPVVVHAPSHRGVKGTRYVLDAVARLQAEGVKLEFILVEGMAHAEAKRIYQRADLLIDQLLAGWYGGLAVEFMALGKPVICYIREDDLKFIPAQMRQALPIINATPDTLYNVLKQWLTIHKSDLPALGKESRVYVERWHDPLKIAASLKVEYEKIMNEKNNQR